MSQRQSIPLFAQVAETIKARIHHYEYKPGGSIPSLMEIESEFGVSNLTARRALERLSAEGYITTRQGLRGQVAEQKTDTVEIDVTGNIQTWFEMACGKNFDLEIDIIGREVIDCPEPIRQLLALDRGEKIERLRRVRRLEGTPISYCVNYGSERWMTGLPSEEIKRRSLLETIRDIGGIKLNYMEQRVEAQTADLDLAAHLGVDFGFPVLFIQTVYYTGKRKPVELTHIYYRADRYSYTAKRRM